MDKQQKGYGYVTKYKIGGTKYEVEITFSGAETLNDKNEFIKKIIVHAPDKSSGRRVQNIQIIFNFIGESILQKEFISDKKEIPQDYF